MRLKGVTTALLLILCFMMLWNVTWAVLPQPQLGGMGSLPSVYSLSATSHEGDIHINHGETFRIHDRQFNMTGTMFVEDNSTLSVENAVLTLTLPLNDSTKDVLVARDNSLVSIVNSTIIVINENYTVGYGQIRSYGQAQVNITESTFLLGYRVFVEAHDNSAIDIENTKMTTFTYYSEYDDVTTYESSSAFIQNSTVDGLFLNNSSKAVVKNSVFGVIMTGSGSPGKTAADITNSEVREYIMTLDVSCLFTIKNSTIRWLSLGQDSSAILTGVTGMQLDADKNATVLLIASSWSSVNMNGGSVLVAGDWPFFWIAVPYTWVLPLKILTVAAIIVGISISVSILREAHSRKKRTEESVEGVRQTSPSKTRTHILKSTVCYSLLSCGETA
jgi:hypothetical protein